MNNKFECALGCHNYTIPNNNVLICENCRRKGYIRGTHLLREGWFDYDDKGMMIHYKYTGWFEEWRTEEGNWTNKKPKNWKYEKFM